MQQNPSEQKTHNTIAWQKNLLRDGYSLYPQLISSSLISAARDEILSDVRENYDPQRQAEYDNISSCPDLRDKPVITDLLIKSPIWNILDEAIGIENIKHDNGQIAIRQARKTTLERVWEPHIDGIPAPNNGLKGSQIQNFTALIGVFLSDTPRDFAGNFTVWPGSHTILEQYFRDNGPEVMNMGMPKVDFGQPVQLSTKAGDAVLCHYQLAHTVATNTSEVDRIAVYFR